MSATLEHWTGLVLKAPPDSGPARLNNSPLMPGPAQLEDPSPRPGPGSTEAPAVTILCPANVPSPAPARRNFSCLAWADPGPAKSFVPDPSPCSVLYDTMSCHITIIVIDNLL